MGGSGSACPEKGGNVQPVSLSLASLSDRRPAWLSRPSVVNLSVDRLPTYDPRSTFCGHSADAGAMGIRETSDPDYGKPAIIRTLQFPPHGSWLAPLASDAGSHSSAAKGEGGEADHADDDHDRDHDRQAWKVLGKESHGGRVAAAVFVTAAATAAPCCARACRRDVGGYTSSTSK
jgi:hypothetical protein